MLSSAKLIVGENFYYYRKEAGLTQNELAERARTGQRTVSKIENCTQNYSIDSLERFCNVLKIPMYKLFTPKDKIDFRELLCDPTYSKGAIMLLYHYYLFMTTVENHEMSDGEYDTYGIALEGSDDVKIEDISTDQRFVKSLVELCNKYQVSPVHFPEIVLDAIEDFNEENVVV